MKRPMTKEELAIKRMRDRNTQRKHRIRLMEERVATAKRIAREQREAEAKALALAIAKTKATKERRSKLAKEAAEHRARLMASSHMDPATRKRVEQIAKMSTHDQCRLHLIDLLNAETTKADEAKGRRPTLGEAKARYRERNELELVSDGHHRPAFVSFFNGSAMGSAAAMAAEAGGVPRW